MILTKEQVFKNMSDEKVVILSVLSKAEFKKLHIKGSQNVPLNDDPALFTKEVGEKYGKGRSFIVYGERFGFLESYEAAKVLNDSGFEARNYSGGVREWHRAGLPVEGTEAGV